MPVTRDSLWYRIGSAIGDALRTRPASSATRTSSAPGTDYPGDFAGRFELTYAPHPDNVADPGEIVWTWVPYQEDHSKGKDRPVLVVGRDRDWLLVVPLSSKDHDRDAAQEASEGRYWADIGTGDWDAEHRPSTVRVDRVVRVDPSKVRRIACRLEEDKFAAVADGIRQHWA